MFISDVNLARIRGLDGGKSIWDWNPQSAEFRDRIKRLKKVTDTKHAALRPEPRVQAFWWPTFDTWQMEADTPQRWFYVRDLLRNWDNFFVDIHLDGEVFQHRPCTFVHPCATTPRPDIPAKVPGWKLDQRVTGSIPSESRGFKSRVCAQSVGGNDIRPEQPDYPVAPQRGNVRGAVRSAAQGLAMAAARRGPARARYPTTDARTQGAPTAVPRADPVRRQIPTRYLRLHSLLVFP